ncbi:MAG: hypothetical protein ACLP1X_01755 [Polyangiaceae bacterium]
MRINATVGVLTVICACSSSSAPAKVAVSDGGSEGGGEAEDGPAAPVCVTKPQSNNAGSCTLSGISSEDAGDAGAPPVWCIEYTGSGLMPSDTAMSCKTMVGEFSMSGCSTVNAEATVAGYCIRSCTTPEEYVQYYYMGSGAVDAKSQCQALMEDVWVPGP